MSWVAPAIGGLGSIAGGLFGASGAKKSAKAQAQAAQQQLALQQQMYLANLGLNEPWRATGQGALNSLARLYGQPYQDYSPLSQLTAGVNVGRGGGGSGSSQLTASVIAQMLRSGQSIDDVLKVGQLADGKDSARVNYLLKAGVSADDIRRLQGGDAREAAFGGAVNNLPQSQGQAGPDLSVFFNSPGYQFRRDEGQRDIGNSFAARGGAFSGNALKGLTDFNQNLASEDYYNFVNQLNNMAGLGQTAANQAGQYGQNFANQGSNALGNYGDARASGIAGKYNMWGQGLGGVANAFGNWWDNRNNPSAQATSGYYTGGA